MLKTALKQRKQLAKKSRKKFIISVLITIILISSTYAWFIGMQTVNMASFNVEIATTDSLLISLDGETWTTEVTINQDMIQEISYDDHTNKWNKLAPISTVGQMDSDVSRMILYANSSFTATYGGYRIMSSRIDNTGFAEGDGYIVFDLFIKNFSGNQYIERLNYFDEEAIYLNTDSEVIVPQDGIQNTGIENAIRVAFSQIGRVSGNTTDTESILGINCYSDTDDIPEYDEETGITGVCRTDAIWEPNDTKHVINAIKWYNASCRARTGFNIALKSSYSSVIGSCADVEDNNYYPTYAIKGAISSAHNVDIYDGVYNGFLHPEWITDLNNPKNDTRLVMAYPYFTDTMKMLRGIDRPEFMRLAANSVTKLRVYIYLEGQDIDNYNYSEIGKKVSIKFGFTKERFSPDDFDYDDPTLDITPPTITILGENPAEVEVGSEYIDSGATALDDVDGNLTDEIEIDSNVNILIPNTYRVIYSVEDSAGNETTKTRYVIVHE